MQEQKTDNVEEIHGMDLVTDSNITYIKHQPLY